MLKHLLFADTSEDLPSARIMIEMRGTIFTLCQNCNLSVVHGPDREIVLQYLKAKTQGDVALRKRLFHHWRTNFYEKKFAGPPFLDEFALVQNALTICLGPSRERPTMRYIILFSKRKQLKKAEMSLYKDYVVKHKFTKCMLVAEDRTPHARNHLGNLDDANVSFQFVIHDKLQSHWFENVFVPTYCFLSEDKQKEKFQQRNIRDPQKCPVLLLEDSVCLQTFASKGDFLEGWDKSITAGSVPLLKLVG